MKTICIEFERELEGRDVIHIKTDEDINHKDAIVIIQSRGYKFNPKYDVIRSIYEV